MTTKEKEKMILPKVTVDDFFSTQEERENKTKDYIEYISISDIDDFPNHPFSVNDDELMENIANSIKDNGFIPPAIIRKKKDGRYEMVAGHRRKMAYLKANKQKMPCIIKNLTDDEATILMVDTNINQRQMILPSERAFAYKMKLDALKHQGKRNDLTSTQVVQKLSVETVAEEMGESREKIRRFIRLTYLNKDLLQYVDNHFLNLENKTKMAMTPAVELSYLTEKEQEFVLEAIEELLVTPSVSQAQRLRNESEKLQEKKKVLQEKNAPREEYEKCELTQDKIDDILCEEKANQKEHIKFSDDELKQYYPKNVITTEEKRKYVLHCVKETSERERRQRQNVR